MKLQDLAEQMARLVAAGYGDREVIAGYEFERVVVVQGPDDNGPDADGNGLMRTVWLELGEPYP